MKVQVCIHCNRLNTDIYRNKPADMTSTVLTGEAGARVSGDLTCGVCCMAEKDSEYTHIQGINIGI